jgi:RimJ/RimL family protein N-acetyltransferase
MNKYMTKDGREFTLRKPTMDDAGEIIRYSRLSFASSDQLLTTPEEYTISVEDEKKWIKSHNDNPNALLLIASLGGQIIGFLFFAAHSKIKAAHTGEFGINVHPEYQGVGIGQSMVAYLLHWARQNKNIEKVWLQVFATNTAAISLYKKLGFTEEGRHIRAIKQPNGAYVDIVQMYILT